MMTVSSSTAKPQLKHRRSSESFHGTCSTPSNGELGVWDGEILPRRAQPNKKVRRARHPVSKENKPSNVAVGISSQVMVPYNNENEQNGARWNIPLEIDDVDSPTRRGDANLRATVASLKMTLEAQSKSQAVLEQKYMRALDRIVALEEKANRNQHRPSPGITYQWQLKWILWISFAGMIVWSSVIVGLLYTF